MNLKDIEKALNKSLGPGTIMNLAETPMVKDGLSSGSFSLNQALSGNPLIGYRWGRIVEIYGPYSSGKTTFALHAIAEAQKEGHLCAFIDAEHALDTEYAERIGVDFDQCSLSQPDYGEKAIETIIAMIEHGFKVIVVDTVAALVPLAELEGEPGDSHMGKHAKLMSQAMKMLAGRVSKSGAIVIFLNQIRSSLVAMGNPETTSGGMALPFYASYRVMVRAPRGGVIKEKSLVEGESEVGIAANLTVVKNKVCPPYRKATVNIIYGLGIDQHRDLSNFLTRETDRAQIGEYDFHKKFLPKKLKEVDGLYDQAIQMLREEYA